MKILCLICVQDPNHSAFATTDDEPDEARMVKKFRRAAAGLEEQLPSDLRPPTVLKRTCDYLFNNVIGNSSSLAHVHHFVWDRTRAIRNDFSIQQLTRPYELRIAIECYERIARFHIVSLHQLALPEKPYSKYDWQQEREQLDRTLLSLMQYYDDSRGRIELPNEGEFRAYCVIFQLQDPIPDLEDRVQTWPRQIIQDTRVRKALDVYMAACNVLDAQGPLKPRASHLIARQDWQRFWTLVASGEVSYLMACVAEIYFNLVRRTVLNALFRTTRASTSLATPDWSIDFLCELLAFDDGEEVYTYCEKFGFTFKEREDGQQYLDLTSVRGRTLPEPAAGIPKQSKTSLVEDKRFGRTIPAIINGLAVKQAQDVGMVIDDEEEMEDVVERERFDPGSMNGTRRESESVDDGESLFLPESKPSAQVVQSAAPLTNGLNDTSNSSQSIFSGFGKPSSFGQPSNTGGGPSVFAPAATQTTKEPQPLTFDIGGSSSTTTAFDFYRKDGLENESANQEKKKPPAFSFTLPPKDSNGVFSDPTTTTSSAAPSIFQTLNPTTTAAPTIEQRAPQFPSVQQTQTTFAPASSAAQPEPPKSPFTVGPAAGVPVTPASYFPSQSSEPKVSQSQPHFTTSPAPPTSHSTQHGMRPALNPGPRRPSSSQGNKPATPSPLSNSITANDEGDNVARNETAIETNNDSTVSGAVPSAQSQIAQPPVTERTSFARAAVEEPEEDLKSIVARVAEEFFYAPVAGVLDQYIEHHVQQTIKQVQRKLEIERLTAHANHERRLALSLKYGRRWRNIFWQHRLAKSGRERRQRRQRRLQERSSQEVEGVSVFGTESVRSVSRTESVREGLDETSGTNNTMGSLWSNPVPIEQPARAGSKRPISSHGTDAPSVPRQNGHKRLKSTSHVDERGRVAKPTTTSHPHTDILKRSSFLGFSPGINGNNKNTTTSNYFRLKAMGMDQIEDSIGLRGTKRRLSASLQSSAQTSPPAHRSPSALGSSFGSSVDKALMPPPPSVLPAVRKTNDKDDALFARLKAARENLEQGAMYLKSETSKFDELGRSANTSQSSNESESPLMVRARADARLRASHSAFGDGASSKSREVPAYRLRESKFVPREQYSKAIDRANELRQSRSRETSRPESRVSQRDSEPDTKAMKMFTPQAAVQQKSSTTVQRSAPQAEKPNGISHATTAPSQPSTFATASNPFSTQAQGPLSFSNHTTHITNDNPFLQSNTANSFNSFVSPPTFGSKANDQLFTQPKDQTVQPSQINQALSNSWGSSHGHGQNHLMSLPKQSPFPPQQDSYLQSQAISLLSDDEDEEQDHSAAQSQVYGNVGHDNGNGDLFDESTEEDELGNSYGHPNPYAALAHDPNLEDEVDFESQVSDEEGYENGDEYPNGYPEDFGDEDPDGYTDDFGDEDEEGIDGDIDEDGEDASGYDEEEDEHVHKHVIRHNQQFPGFDVPNPPKPNPALQVVGNSVEEAIELSD